VRSSSPRVYLIGAGPGAADLITLRAARTLAAADVVLVDDLVNRDVLVHCRAAARIVAIGKRAGCRSTPQAFIERLMLRYARQGYTVVRLKGGDPFVFGRGAEELEFLARHGIAAEVVCGITAGIAVPAALGIALTHREVARGVTFVSGHAHDGNEPDWRALRATGTTLVIYMGITRVRALVSAMLEAGFPADVPACAIQNGTLATQEAVVTTLGDLPAAVAQARLGSPAILVIGEVVRDARIATALAVSRAVGVTR